MSDGELAPGSAGLRRSTLRGYQIAVRLFCGYITDPVYGWSAECEKWFGTHPVLAPLHPSRGGAP